MPFECRVLPDEDLRAAVRSGPSHIACYLPRLLSNDIFSTTGDEEFLEFVELVTRGRPRPGVLIHSSYESAVTWIGRSKKRAHVRFYGPAPAEHVDGDPSAHHWVRGRIFQLGAELQQAPDIEFDVDGARKRICDVVWLQSRIAWEVDLSPQPKTDQLLRQETCKRHGLTMVSVIDENDPNRTNERVPRVVVRKLKASAEKPDVAPWGFARSYINNFREVKVDASGYKWDKASGITLEGFCEELIARDLRYYLISGRFFWVRASDIAKYAVLQREAQARAQREAQQRKNEKALELATLAEAQAEERRLNSEAERARRGKFVRDLRDRIEQMDTQMTPSRQAMLKHISSLGQPDALGTAQNAVFALGRALAKYESAWSFWRWPLVCSGPCDAARAVALEELDKVVAANGPS